MSTGPYRFVAHHLFLPQMPQLIDHGHLYLAVAAALPGSPMAASLLAATQAQGRHPQTEFRGNANVEIGRSRDSAK